MIHCNFSLAQLKFPPDLMNTEAIAKAARLDVEGWLDTRSTRRVDELACSIHSNLVSAPGAHKAENARELFIQRLNGHAENVLGSAANALSVLQDPRVTYAVEDPGDDQEPGSHFTGAFVDVHFIDPLAALQALKPLRSAPPALQISAIRLVEAELQVLQASQAVGMAFLSADDRESFWPDGLGDEPPKLVVGNRPLERRLSLKDREEAARDETQRSLYKAERTVAKLSHAVPEHIRRLCSLVIDVLQAQGSKSAPLPIAVPEDIQHDNCAAVARGYDALAWALDVGTSSKIDGPIKRAAKNARQALEGCVAALKVLAGWVRALGELQASPRCEFCYRHRSTKKRCAVHSVKEFITKEARMAAATRPLYVERFTALARAPSIQRALKSSLQVDVPARNAAEVEIQGHDLPKVLVPQVAKLALQLRRIRPVFGASLEGEVALLFQKLLALATETHQRPLGRSDAERNANRDAQDTSRALLTLRGFLVTWCSTGRPFPQSFPTFAAEGHDAAHPIVRDEPIIESEIALSFLRQRAWIEAEAELRQHTEINRDAVIDMRDRGMSFDAIAVVHGCSHDTIAKIVASGATPRKRARLVGYVAKSRLGGSKTESVPHRGRL